MAEVDTEPRIVPRWLHVLQHRVLVPVITVVAVINLLEGALHRVTEYLPGHLAHIIAHPFMEILVEIALSSVLSFIVQFSRGTIVRGAIIASLTTLGAAAASIAYAGNWVDAAVFGGAFGLVFFTPLFELPFLYVHHRAQLAREERERDEEPFALLEYGGGAAYMPNIGLLPSTFVGLEIAFLYLFVSALYMPAAVAFGIYYLGLSLPLSLTGAVLFLIGFGVGGLVIGYTRLEFEVDGRLRTGARELSLAAGVAGGVAIALALQIILDRSAIQLGAVWRQLFAAEPSAIKFVLVCWLLAAAALIAAFMVATFVKLVMLGGWPMRRARWFVGAAVVGVLALVGHLANEPSARNAAIHLAVNLGALIASTAGAFVGAFLAARR